MLKTLLFLINYVDKVLKTIAIYYFCKSFRGCIWQHPPDASNGPLRDSGAESTVPKCSLGCKRKLDFERRLQRIARFEFFNNIRFVSLDALTIQKTTVFASE